MSGSEKDSVFYSNLHKSRPIVDKGNGVWLWDSQGRKYLDAAGGSAVVNLGHGVSEIIEDMQQQAQKVSYVHRGHFTSDAAIDLAEKTLEFAPNEMSKVFFIGSGSEATETALKMARKYHLERGNDSKYKVIARWQSYHGNTIGALSMAGRPQQRRNWSPYLLDFPHIPPPYCYRCPYGLSYPDCEIRCAHELENTIKLEGSDTISAFIAEPIIGTTATAVAPPKEYFPIVRRICDKHDVVLIVDEVFTGFGRTGKNFAIDHYGVTPDIMATGKCLTGGYAPLASVVAREKIVDSILEGSGVFSHGHAYTANPLCCSAGLSVLRYLERNNLVERSAKMGEVLLDKLAELEEEFQIIGDIRGTGLFAGIEFVKDKENKTPFEKEKRVAERIKQYAFDEGLMLVSAPKGNVDGVRGDQIQITPPFIITTEEIQQIVDILGSAIKQVQEEVNL